ncbi:MAG: hypothetical protein JNJ69_06795 [Leptospiraceae bacterium]|nr:hypothetical protein [Leptospiraceae bacterium]
MDINPVNNLADGLADMAQMLKQITEAKLALDDKMLGAAVAEGEASEAKNLDTYA